MKRFNKTILVLLILVGGFLCFYGYAHAKYISNTIWDFYLKSRGFYFTSDYLDSASKKNVDNVWNGESVHFNLENDLNQSVITNYDISYNVACTINGDVASHATCRLNGTNENTLSDVLPATFACINNTDDQVDVSGYDAATCDSSGYSWTNQITSKDLYFDVVLTDYNYQLKEVTVTIIATSTSPYRKVLSGDFVLSKSNMSGDNLTTWYKNEANYGRLVISNSYASSKCVEVKWDSSKLLIDKDAGAFSSYTTDSSGYLNEIKFAMEAKSSLSYIFYKRDVNETVVPETDLSVEEASGCN